MYVGKLTIARQDSSDEEAVSEAINSFLGALRMNGQACGQFPIAITSEGYVATVSLPEKTSLNAVHHNRYVRAGLRKLEKAGLAKPEYEIYEDLEGTGVCACERPPSYILYTTYISRESPLRCGGCFLPIPLYRIPPMSDDEYNDILSWQSYYQACDTLQMNFPPIERTAIRQLTRWDSGLSQEGLALCRKIKKQMRVPVYYYLYRHNARSLLQEKKRLCPSCQGEWLLPEPWHRFDFKCDRCGLISNIAWTVRPEEKETVTPSNNLTP